MTRRLIFIICTFAAILGGIPQTAAQSVNLRMSNQVIQGQRFTISIVVSNGDANITRNDAPALAGCTLYAGPGLTTSYSTQIINGQQSSSVTKEYTFTYTADKAGTVNVPPIKVTVNGKAMQTQARSFTILPPDKAQQQRQGARPGMGYGYPTTIEEMEELMNELMGGGAPGRQQAPRQQQPQQQITDSKVSPNDFIIVVHMSKNDIYEKEAVIATIKLYTKHNVLKFQPVVMPQFEGFLSEEIDVSNQQPVLEHFRGDNYYTLVLKKCLLYPQKSGKLKINSGTYDVTLETVDYVSNGYYATPVPKKHNITTTSNSLTVNVKPLPTPAPISFNGAVGDFDVTATLNPEQLRTNEAARYQLIVSGTGNIKHLAEPTVPLPATVEEYTPTGESNARFNGSNMQGTYTATYTFIPKVTGELEIPAWEFSYFNPSTGQYVTKQLPAFNRMVVKGVSGTTSSSSETMDTGAIRDIRHIQKVNEENLTMRPKPVFDSFWYWFAYILCLGALVTAVLVYKRHLRLAADVQGMRIRKARSVATKRLAKAHSALKAHRSEEYYAALSAALWGFLSDKLKIAASSLTRENIADKLAEAGAQQSDIDRTIALLDECEMARFTPNHSDSEMSSLYSEASNIIDTLNRLKGSSKPKETYMTSKSRYGG